MKTRLEYSKLFKMYLKDKNDKWEICYSTHITDDVEGYLTNKNVLKLLEEIKKLEVTNE